MRNIIVILILMIFCRSYSQASQKSLPEIKNYVTDLENVLEEKEELSLLKTILSFNLEKGYLIFVVSVDTFGEYDNIHDFALSLAQKNDVGHSWIIFSKNMKQVSIQNSDYIREKLTDEESEKIVKETFIPNFLNEKYFNGLVEGIEIIKKELN